MEQAQVEAVEVKVRMILSPLAALLRSRKFMVAIVSLLVALLVTAVPQFASVQTELITLITVVALAVIGGTAWEDSAALKAVAQENAGKSADELAKEVAVILIDELARQGKSPPDNPAG
jgi:hypothetical protein